MRRQEQHATRDEGTIVRQEPAGDGVAPKASPSRGVEYRNFSGGQAASEGSWASGTSPDGLGQFSYVAQPEPGVPMPPPTHPDSRFYGTTELPNLVEKVAGSVQDKLKKE